MAATFTYLQKNNPLKYLSALIYSNHTGVRILRHFLFWAIDIINWIMVFSATRTLHRNELFVFLLTIPLVIASTYFIMYVLVPGFSTQGARGKSLVYVFLTLCAMALSIRLLKYYVLFPLFEPSSIQTYQVWGLQYLIGEIFRWLAVICMAVAIKVIKSKIDLEKRHELLLKEKKEAELNFLKAHMHPHFLFNTLNTLYGETIRESKDAEKIVLHLSNLLRFTLEECNKPQITLKKELQVIRDYINLEKLRHGERLNVSFDVRDIDENILISPLLLLPFVENSFKHTLGNIRGEIRIVIKVVSVNNALVFTVENDHVGRPKISKLVPDYPKGISNVQRQLELLHPDNYELKVEDLRDKFHVTLKIPTNASII